MEERRYDGTQKLTDNPRLSELFKAVADTRNKVVALHKPGSMVTKDDGSRWIVQTDGTWREARPEEQP